MSAGSVGYAIAAAVCLALASAWQHQAATSEYGYHNGLHLLWRLARSKRWMTGLAAAAAGTLLHAAALRAGALAVVEPVLVMSVALALPVRSLLEGNRPAAGQVLAAVVLAIGVGVFVASAHPLAGRAAPAAGGAVVVIAAGVAIAALCSLIAARARSSRVTGFALGLAAGTLYGVAGGILKAAVHAVLSNPAAAAAGWTLWALALLGAWALILHQRAYTRAPLGVSLPALSVANPLAGMVFGMLAFGETPASAPLALLGEALGLAVIVASVTVLARTRAAAGPAHPDPARAAAAAAAPRPAAASEEPRTCR